MTECVIRPFVESDLAEYRRARLTALKDHPEAYSCSWEEEREFGDPVFLDRILPEPPSLMLGAFAGPHLAAMAVLVVPQRAKTRHVGTINGVYVEPAFRGTGLGRALMEALLASARESGLLAVTLTVSVGNESARRLYAGLGFERYGLVRRALRVGDRFFDDEHMVIELD
jgi:ribosomal protein S18 acetylase RimI-like enzyme